MGADKVQIRSAGRVLQLSGDGVADTVPVLLGALDGRSTVTELAARFGLDVAIVEGVVARLGASGFVQDAAAWEAVAGPANVRDHLADHGLEPSAIQRRLAEGRVGFTGRGPVGGLAAQHLSAAGVGEVVLMGGATPVPADPDAQPGLLEQVDLLLVEVDEPGDWALDLNGAACHGQGRFLPYSVSSHEAVVGPLVSSGPHACHLCAQSRRLSHLRHYDAYLAYRDAVREGAVSPPPVALLPGHTSLVAGALGLEALRIIGGFAPPVTLGAVLVVDFATLEVRREDVLAVPGCPACGQEVVEVQL